MYTNIIHNDDICNYFLKNQQFIFNSLGNCRECRMLSSLYPLTRDMIELLTDHPRLKLRLCRIQLDTLRYLEAVSGHELGITEDMEQEIERLCALSESI